MIQKTKMRRISGSKNLFFTKINNIGKSLFRVMKPEVEKAQVKANF